MFNKLLMSSILFSLVLVFGCRQKIDLTDPGPGTNLLISNTETINTFYMLTPREGDSFLKGRQITIGWYVVPTIEAVSLSLYKKDVEITEIAGSTTNDGRFLWKIPEDIPISNRYRIKLSNTSVPTQYVFSKYFEITVPPDSAK